MRIARIALGAFLLVLGAFSNVYADEVFFSTMQQRINEDVDCSDKQFIRMSASGYESEFCFVEFDFTEGNQTIVAVNGDECMIAYFFDDYELLRCFDSALNDFSELEAQLPEGKRLSLGLRLSKEEKRLCITSDEYQRYFQ